jgi:hypothetical protein
MTAENTKETLKQPLNKTNRRRAVRAAAGKRASRQASALHGAQLRGHRGGEEENERMVCGCNEVVRRREGKQGCDFCQWSPAARQADQERGGAACRLDSLGFDSRPASFSAI